jgi:hypothetical protein
VPDPRANQSIMDYGTIDLGQPPPTNEAVSRGGAAVGPGSVEDYGNIDLVGDSIPGGDPAVGGDGGDPAITETEGQDPGQRAAGSLFADLPQSEEGDDLELDQTSPDEDKPRGTVFGSEPPDLSGLSKATGEHPTVPEGGLGLPSPSQTGSALPAVGPGTGEEPAVTGAAADSAKQFAVAELFKLIDKAVKTLNLYEGRGESCVKSVDLAYRNLREVLSQFGEITLRVTPYEFFVEGGAVYTSKEDRRGITYRLFRDGVRELELLPLIERDEFAELLEILRRVQPVHGEDDTVTMLWERNLQGVRYQAIDLFLEGMVVAETDELQEQIDALMQEACQPLHGLPQIGAAQEIKAQLSAEILQQARAKREQRLAAVQGAGVEDETTRAALAEEVQGLSEDLWKRTGAVMLRLMELGRGAATTRLLVQLVEQMMLEGRWELLAAACRSLGEVLERVGGLQGKAAQGLRAALIQLCADDKLMVLEGLLGSCSLPEFRLLAELLRILPPEADGQLVRLLATMPQGEVQDNLVTVLRERKVDLTDHYRERLNSPNLMHVIYAIHDLKALGHPRSYEAIKSAADHPSPKVRAEVFRALGDKIDEEMIPDVISALTLESRELREQAFGLLAKLRMPALVPRLIQITKRDDYEEWSRIHREHLLALIVRWGGPESNDYIIRGITSKNPLRRKKVDALREELIAVLRRMAGTRSHKLLRACLDARPSKQVRATLQEAIQDVERKAQAKARARSKPGGKR